MFDLAIFTDTRFAFDNTKLFFFFLFSSLSPRLSQRQTDDGQVILNSISSFWFKYQVDNILFLFFIFLICIKQMNPFDAVESVV